MKACPQCKAVSSEYSAYCYRCGKSFEMSKSVEMPEPPQDLPEQTSLAASTGSGVGSERKIPFEEWQTRGFFRSLLETWIQASFYPKEFYPLVGKTENIISAVLFFLIWEMFGAFLGFFLSLLFPNPMLHSIMKEFGGSISSHPGSLILFQLISLLFFYPFVLLAGLFLWSAVVYFLLSVLNGVPKGFKTTLITIAYASAPAIIPYLIGWIWSLVVQIIGLSESQESSIWKPALAVGVPFLGFFLVVLMGLSTLLAAHFFNIPGFKP